MRRLSCLLWAITTSTALALPVPLANPGAEIANGSVPASVNIWTSDHVTAHYARDTIIKRSGDASFYIRNEGADRRQDSGSAVYIITGPLVPDLRYTAIGWIKTRDAVEAGLALRCKSVGGGWSESYAICDKVTGTHDWMRVQCTWTAAPGQTEFNLFLRVGVKGEAWFDDLEIHDDFEDPAQVAAFASRCEQLQQLTNRLANWSGEFGASLAADALPRLAELKADVDAYVRELAPAMLAGDVPFELRRRRADLARRMDVVMLGARRIEWISRVMVDAAGGGRGAKPQADVVLGWASAMSHVFLRDCPFPWQAHEPGRILAVKGETEAIQLVLLPVSGDLKQVNVTAGSLCSGAGNVLAAERIAVHPVGFVKTTVAPTDRLIPVEHEYQGWWPDLLLEPSAFDVQRGDTQPVWISVTVPVDQPAGIYEGEIEVTDAAGFAARAPLIVEVADVVQPDRHRWAFRNLMSFHEPRAKNYYGENWTPAMQEKYFDFLLERRVCVLSMYGNEDYETLENLKRFAARGQNVFLLDWYTQEGHVIESNAARMRHRVGEFYPALEELGYLDHAYVYGWDEIGEPQARPDLYAEVRYAAEVLAQEFPGIRLLSAGTDRAFGTNSPLNGLTNLAYCPQIGTHWDSDAARRSRAAGNQVWWYDVTWTIDQPLIRGRLLAWQTWKVDSDGFLIWTLNRWKANDKFINKAILADYWNPTLEGQYENSSAMYVYPGENGPISSLRLENYRDGSEDYGLLAEARNRLAFTTDDTSRRLLEEAIRIDDGLTRDLRTFANDPPLLAEHRERLIRALEQTSNP